MKSLRTWFTHGARTVIRQREGFADYIALAIVVPVLLMTVIGGMDIVEAVSTQAAMHTVAGIADRTMVADGCITSNALQAIDTTLKANNINPTLVTMNTTSQSTGTYGSRGLGVKVGYDLNLALPGTHWTVAHDYVEAQVANDQSQYVPQDGVGNSGCAASSAIAGDFTGTVGGQGGSGGGSGQAPPAEASSVSLTVSPNPAQVGSALTVSGVASAQGSALANAAVSVSLAGQGSTTVSTNSQGQYTASLTPSQAGSLTVTVTAGNATNQAAVTVQPASAAKIVLTAPSPAVIAQAFTINGTVLTANGQPVSDGMSVTVSSNAAKEIRTQTVTTSGGQFSLTVPSGLTSLMPSPVTVTATSGAASQTASMTVQPGQPQAVTLSVSPAKGTAGSTWTVSGTVQGPDHTAVQAGTSVTLASPNDTTDTLPTLKTNAQGQFSGAVTLTQAGSITLNATAGTVTSAPVTVTVTPGAPYSMANLIAQPNPVNQGSSTVITGTVVDQYGNPVASGQALTLSSSAWTTPYGATTGANGAMQVPVVFNQSGAQVVTVLASGTALQGGTLSVEVNQQGAYSITPAQNHTTMTAGGTRSVTFTLTNSQGQAVAGKTLNVSATPSSAATLSEATGITDAQGQITLTVSSTQAGILTVTAALAADNDSTSGSASWTVAPAAPAQIHALAISPSTVRPVKDTGSESPVVTGVVTDGYGNPVPAASVSITGGWDPGQAFTGTTSSTGSFAVTLDPVTVGGPYDPTLTVSTAAGSFTKTYSTPTLTVANPAAYTLVPTYSSQSQAAGTPASVVWTLENPEGQPVSGQTVQFTASPAAQTTLSETSGATDARGQITMTVTPTQAGSVTETATMTRNSSTISGTATWTVTPAAPASLTDLTITPTTTHTLADGGTPPKISGIAVDLYGNSVPSATVTVTGGWDPGVKFTGTTNSQGDFAIALSPTTPGGPYDPTVAVSTALGSFTQTYQAPTLTVINAVYTLTANDTQPTITGVTFSGSGQNTTITVTGNNFGTAPVAMPYSGDISDFRWTSYDAVVGLWNAGSSANGNTNSVTLNYQSWSNTEIVIDGFGSGYSNDFFVAAGDPYTVTVINPQSQFQAQASGTLAYTGANTVTQTESGMPAGQPQSVEWTLTDSAGHPVPNATVNFTANPSATTTLSETSGVTNAQGQVTLSATATQAGLVTVTGSLALDQGQTTATASWMVYASAPAAIDGLAISPSVVQSTQDGGTLDPLVTGTVLDQYGNPVPGVTIQVTGGWDPGVTASGVTTSQGTFSVALTPQVVGGHYHPTITVDSPWGYWTHTYSSVSLSVVAQAYSLTLIPTNGSSSTPAGTPYGVTAVLTEYGAKGQGAPIANQSVTFTVTSSDTGYWAKGTTQPTPASPQSVTVTTNSQGEAGAAVAFEPNTGSQTVQVTYGSDNAAATLPVTVTNNTPSQMITEQLAGYPASFPPYWQNDFTDYSWNFKDTAGRELVVVFIATDSDGFPVANGEPVQFSVDNISNTTGGGPTEMGYGSNGTDGAGYGSYVWYGGEDYPTVTGTFYPTVTINGVTFSGTAAPRPAASP